MKIEDFVNMPGVLILRGIAGSGKSTLVKTLQSALLGNRVWVCSADHYFEDGQGNYNFDLSELGKAHAQCLELFIESARVLYDSFIVVDNTNINIEDIAPYFAVAQAYDLDVKIVQMPHISAEEAFNRNIHNVPIKTLQYMEQNLKRSLPKRMQQCLTQL